MPWNTRSLSVLAAVPVIGVSSSASPEEEDELLEDSSATGGEGGGEAGVVFAVERS